MPVLWTDFCFLGLLIGTVFAIGIHLRKKSARLLWQALFRKPLANAAFVILLFFLIMGTLDCLHVNNTKEGNSDGRSITRLDVLLSPLHRVEERTYSEPFALKTFSPEFLLVAGIFKKTYPRLSYPPKNLSEGRDKQKLILDEIGRAFFQTVILTLALLFIFFISFRRLDKGKVTCIATFFLTLLIWLSLYHLSRYFHVFGTGKIGQDIFYYALKSIRTALVIGTVTTVLMAPIAILFGIIAGYYGGKIDDFIQYIYTTLSSIPGVLLVTASVLSMQTFIMTHPNYFKTIEQGADARLLALCLILGVTSWTSLCRLLRAEALKLRQMDFVLAATLLGRSTFSIFIKHFLPNMMPIVLITIVMDFSFLVLAEAVLSYVGAGVSPLTMSFGNLINAARLELSREPIVWWPMLAAFFSMIILVLASNIFADAVREVLDPHQKNLESFDNR